MELAHGPGAGRLAEQTKENTVKWVQMYLVGYVIVVGGLVAALWKLGVIERVGPAWTAIGIVIAIGSPSRIAGTRRR
jgi:hypothetical protein